MIQCSNQPISPKSSGPRCNFCLCCASRVGFPGILCGYIDQRIHSKTFRVARAKGAISGKQLLAGVDVSETMRKHVETKQIIGPERGEGLVKTVIWFIERERLLDDLEVMRYIYYCYDGILLWCDLFWGGVEGLCEIPSGSERRTSATNQMAESLVPSTVV